MAYFLSWLKLESLQRIKKTQSTWQKCYDRCYLDEFDYNCIYWRFNIKNISTAKYDCKKDWSHCWRVFNCLNTATNLKDIWWPKAISHWSQDTKTNQSSLSLVYMCQQIYTPLQSASQHCENQNPKVKNYCTERIGCFSL